MLIYMAITAAILYIMPVDQHSAGSALVASDAASIAFGSLGGSAIALLICLSVLGATNGNVLSAPRMTFAMAQEGNFFPQFGKVQKNTTHPVMPCGCTFYYDIICIQWLILHTD
jgi:APA family basic amino acid/polyamine antiporter